MAELTKKKASFDYFCLIMFVHVCFLEKRFCANPAPAELSVQE